MYYGVAFILRMVIYILFVTKNGPFGSTIASGHNLPAPDSVWAVHLFLIHDSDLELVFVACRLCHYASLCAFHENALLHIGQQRFQGAKGKGPARGDLSSL